MNAHIWIEHVTPSVDGGRFPAKRVAGETVPVEADILRDGHASIAAVVRYKRQRERSFREAPMRPVENDRWRGHFPVEENTRYQFTVAAWTDVFRSWYLDLLKWIEAGQDIRSEVAEGLRILRPLLPRARPRQRRVLERVLERLEVGAHDPETVRLATGDPALHEVVSRLWPREDLQQWEPPLELVVDRERALFSAWYEMFPRSQGTVPGRHATLREAERRLPHLRDMGFDVVYLPPIHPVGETHRKGRNNTLVAQPGDPGSPWAIGSAAGGHTAVHPDLGTVADFEHFVRTAANLGLEVALDYAIQASPDHPWVREHPEWFHHRPDGTIKYAENPPKKYQDIYPINFDTRNWKALWEELRRIVLFWIGHGVRIFRVDNPHTKPLAFWEWLIRSVRERHPEVIFLSEAFTRPKMMRALAKAGFSKSYTYYTWRNTKAELTEYLTELTQTESAEYFRPNFFINTPDILPRILQTGRPAAFKMRLVLAATLSPSYGIHSGYELCEHEAIPGSEEYDHSEKYEIKVRDWNAPGNINEYIALVNRIRHENPALRRLTNLRFLPADGEHILFCAKSDPGADNVLLVAVNLDPHHVRDCTVQVPPAVAGVPPGGGYEVHDLLSGERYRWGEYNYVRLDPAVEPAHILRVETRFP